MTNLRIPLQNSVTGRVIDRVAGRLSREKNMKSVQLCLDLEDVSFIDPAGMVGLLELMRWGSDQGVAFSVKPPGENVSSYMARMGFWTFAAEIAGIAIPADIDTDGSRGDTDVLLEITPVRESVDVHTVLDLIRDRAGRILETHLNYPVQELDRFLTALSEICQNIVEHSGDEGWVAVQKYFYRETLGRNAVKLVVSDLGIGIEQSLRDRCSGDAEEEWSDRVAIEHALYENISRFEDPGRGHGLLSVRKSTAHWNGRLCIRSGTARVAMVPDWDDRTEKAREGLADFPGTQVTLLIPEKTSKKEQGRLF